MAFSEEELANLGQAYLAIRERYNALLMAYTQREYVSDKAKEYATQGYPRRLKILTRCIEQVFDLLPPESADIPSTEAITDATINVQAFVFNVFGALDNLAWIWVYERGVLASNGDPLPAAWIGIAPKNGLVRASFS
jgi:hypothetical protein